LSTIFKTIFEIIINVVFPPRCPMCDRVITVSDKGKLCRKCESEVITLDDQICMKCGRKIADTREEYCISCKSRRHVFSQGKVMFSYDGCVRNSLHRFKYANRKEYAQYYGEKAAERYGDWIRQKEIGLIVPVPMHKKKKNFRGYNQAEVFARCLSDKTGIPYTTEVKRVKNTKPQSGMNETERKNNLQNAFKISTNVVKYKRILLVDDIYTTGSTVDELARVLIQEQAYEIFVLCIASGEG